MRILLLLFVISFFPTSILSKEILTDSLVLELNRAKTQQERVQRILNLDNYKRNILCQDSVELTRQLLKEGIEARNEYAITDALRKLVMSVDRKNRVLTNDSVIRYLKLAETHLTGERKRSFITEVSLRHIRSLADWAKSESDVIEELSARYTSASDKSNDIYFQIEGNYALGMAAALTMSETHIDTYKNALRYFDRLFELIQKLPIEYGAEILFWVNDNIYLCYLNSHHPDKVAVFLEKMMDILKRYKELPEVKADVYQNFEYVYSLYYMGMGHIPATVGYKKAFDCLQKADVMLRRRNDLLTLYFSYKGFYDDLKNSKMSILYGDSIVEIMKVNDTPVAKAVISSMYKEMADSYAALNDYPKAFKLILAHDSVQEEIRDGESKELRADMEARYDLNYLELEKERLTSRNRQIAFFFVLFVFLLSVGWGFSQRYHLNKLKRMQKKLIESNEEVVRQSEKAQESEKMKTAFINSMCHEIRTPLNSINGFSTLLLDESIDAECKEEFPELIQKNTDLLTKLLNDLLEVSNLSSSAEELPTEQTDLHVILTEEMEKLKLAEGKENIQYRLDIGEDCSNIRTNALYLSQTIAHLLNNANKFTENGQITLKCHRSEKGQLVIKVTDTGIGIPADKQEWVFERFTKLDDFKSGTGLGLYICRLIVNRLGGSIYIDHEYVEGTSIVMIFPL